MRPPTRAGHPIGKPLFSSEREWLDHLRVLAELPYPSVALMPGILPAIRGWIRADMGGFGWADKELNPIAFLSERMNERAFDWYLRNLHVAFRMHPLQLQIESGGDIARQMALSPSFEETEFYREIFQSYGFRWFAIAPAKLAGGEAWGFLSVYRSAEDGAYSDDEQATLVRGMQALSGLDRRDNPLAELPNCVKREAESVSLLLRPDGVIAARSQEAMQMLYLLGGADMHSLEWARPDWFAMPAATRQVAQDLFSHPTAEGRRKVRVDKPWGTFDFVLEKTPDRLTPEQSVIMMSIRHYEPIDIAVAMRLAGWRLSPREKRIVIASTRTSSLTELADVLGITTYTLKSYNKEMVDRLGVGSRQAFIDQLLDTESAFL